MIPSRIPSQYFNLTLIIPSKSYMHQPPESWDPCKMAIICIKIPRLLLNSDSVLSKSTTIIGLQPNFPFNDKLAWHKLDIFPKRTVSCTSNSSSKYSHPEEWHTKPSLPVGLWINLPSNVTKPPKFLLCSLTQHFHSLVVKYQMISNLQLVMRISIFYCPSHITFTAV